MSDLSRKKNSVFVWLPKHSVQPLCVCTSMTQIKNITGSHIETIRKNIREHGYYECQKGIAYQTTVVRTKRVNNKKKDD